MSEYPYGMMVIAVVGIISAFLWAREPSSGVPDASVNYAASAVNEGASMIAQPPVQQAFPVQAWGRPGTEAQPAPSAVPSSAPQVAVTMPRGPYVANPPNAQQLPPGTYYPPRPRY